MPPNAKSKKAKKSTTPPAPPPPDPRASLLALHAQTERYTESLLYATPLRRDFVHLSLHLLDCPYIVHEWCFTLHTSLAVIVDRLERQHGCGAIRLYRAPANESNELIDRSLTLEQLGCVGSARHDTADMPVIRYDMVYDIAPKHQGPIVMREPDLSRVNPEPLNLFINDRDECGNDREHYDEEKTPVHRTITIEEWQLSRTSSQPSIQSLTPLHASPPSQTLTLMEGADEMS